MASPEAEQPQLLPAQQEALVQFMAVTNESEAASRAILQRSAWSVPVAIAKFFDGESDIQIPPEPAPPQAPLQAPFDPNLPFRPPIVDEDAGFRNLQAALHVSNLRRTAATERTEVARRVVAPPPPVVYQPPFLLGLLLTPLGFAYRALGSLCRMVVYFMALIPGFGSLRARGTALATGSGAGSGRRKLSPRDAAGRFKREIEETYGSKVLPLLDMGYAQAYDKAKNEPSLLLVVLLSPEHDDTRSFVRDTLLAPAVLELLNTPSNHILLWGGNVRDAEAFQVYNEFKCTKLPFVAVVCVTPKEGGGSGGGGGSSTRMGVVKRMLGPIPATVFATQLQSVVRKYSDDLAAVRAVRVANETSRSIRAEQDNAYAESLARDRERVRQRQEAERLAREKVEAAARQARLRKQWRQWRKSTLAPEPAAGTPDMVRVALKLPEAQGGERVRRSFTNDASVEDLYAFVECFKMGGGEEGEDEGDDGAVDEKVVRPEGYTHEYKFRIASMMPREVHEPSETAKLMDAIGKSASLVVEEVEEEEEEEEEEE